MGYGEASDTVFRDKEGNGLCSHSLVEPPAPPQKDTSAPAGVPGTVPVWPAQR